MDRQRPSAPLALGLALGLAAFAAAQSPTPWTPAAPPPDASVADWAATLAKPAPAPPSTLAVAAGGERPDTPKSALRLADPEHANGLPADNPLRVAAGGGVRRAQAEAELAAPPLATPSAAPIPAPAAAAAEPNPFAVDPFATNPFGAASPPATAPSAAPATTATRIAVGASALPTPAREEKASTPPTVTPSPFDSAPTPPLRAVPRVSAAEAAPSRPEASAPTALEGASLEGVGEPGPTRLEGPQEAALVLEKRAPHEAQIGKPCHFVVKVRNTGTAPAEEVILTDVIPAGARLTRTTPPADVQGTRLVWRLGTLPAGEERSVEVEVEPLREGPLGSVATVSMAASASGATRCTRPRLAVRVSAEERVLVGDDLTVGVEVHNPGTGAATGVMLVADVPPQLRHEAGSALEYEVGSLAPGETRRIELRMTAAEAGAVASVVTATGDGDLRAEDAVKLVVVAPALEVSVDGPTRRYLERPASYTIGVDNPGTAPARDVRLVTHLPRGMEFVSANNLGEYDGSTHSVYWSLAELPDGERGEVELVARPMTPGEHVIRVAGEARDGVQAEHSHSVLVEGVVSLAFEVRDLEDPVDVGGETVYEVRVLNEGTKTATGVRVRVEAPGGVRLVAADGDAAASVEPRRAVFNPLTRLDPGQKAAFRVRAVGAEPGDQRVTVVVEADGLSRPIRREESTHVFGDE